MSFEHDGPPADYTPAFDVLEELAELQLQLNEQKHLEGLEVIHSDESFALFDAAEITTDRRGNTYVSVPDRVVMSDSKPPQILSVWGLAHSPEDQGVTRVQHGGRKYFVPHLVVGEVAGKPLVQIEVGLQNPVRNLPRSLEEQKLVVKFGNEGYWAQPCREHLVGAQGTEGVLMDGFLSVERPNVEIESQPPGQPRRLQPGFAPRLIVPADITTLMEFQAMLPNM